MVTENKHKQSVELSHSDLTRLSTRQLDERLEAFFRDPDDSVSGELVRELVNELQVHQNQLEKQTIELQEAQRLLEESRNRYAELYDSAPVSYVTFDSAGYIQEINLAGASLLGQERASLLGKPFQRWLRQDDTRAFLNHLNAAGQSRAVVHLELQIQIPNQSYLEVRLESVASNRSVNNKPLFHTTITHIYSRREADRVIKHQDRQLRLLSDAIPTFIAYVNREERLTIVNRAYELWFKAPREQIQGKTIREVAGEKIYAEIAGYVRAALEGKPISFEVTYPVVEGDERLLSVSYIPDFSERGDVLGYFSMARDVTMQRKHEAMDKMRMLEMARVARINTMGEMVAELAHELNQPLAAISIYSDAVKRMLDRDSLDIPDIRNALNEIRLQARRAGDVINALVEEVMNLITVEARWHNVKITLELGEAIPPIEVDRILIEQVILNLTRNAIEAMDAIEKTKRWLVIRTALSKHNEIELSIDDNGPGIPKAEMDKIFEPYYTLKEHGMGLGLGISRSIIRAHHGRLWGIPNEHGGTIFTFTLPCQDEDEAA
ncbi:MAG: PAS domain-containing protein [Gammaproteobacteria bacterium]